jgi:hypothetical protein
MYKKLKSQSNNFGSICPNINYSGGGRGERKNLLWLEIDETHLTVSSEFASASFKHFQSIHSNSSLGRGFLSLINRYARSEITTAVTMKNSSSWL